MNRMAQSCGPRATRCAASAIWRGSLIRLRIITTRLEALGAQCVNCHMPTKTYMVVHDRRDHSIRVPRPDLSLSIGTPNATPSVRLNGRQMQLRFGIRTDARQSRITARAFKLAASAPSMQKSSSTS
jgi:hypothetical protein